MNMEKPNSIESLFRLHGIPWGGHSADQGDLGG